MDTGSSTLITRLALIMLKFCIIILFWNSSILLPLFQCKSCYCAHNYAHFMIAKTHIPPTGIHLSPLFILAAVTDGRLS